MDKLPIAEGASFDSHSEEHNARCLVNTRVELQRHIMQWAENKSSKPIFWLSGMAGTGKSTIARTVAQSLAERRQLGASFFFKKGEGHRANATRFFTTIARDLAHHIPEMKASIGKAIDTDPTIFSKALKDQFEMLVLLPLSETTQRAPKALHRVVVIDALDECEREEDIEAILRLLAQIKEASSASLHILVTSRREPPIRLGFKQMSDGTYQDLILHKVPKEAIEHDIALFLEHELEEIRKRRSIPPPWPSTNDIRVLVQMAVPLFIFAATACRYIKDNRDNPKKRLKTILEYQAKQISQLEKTYLPILRQLLDDENEMNQKAQFKKFQEIVGSIVILENPLSINSLENLLCVPKDDINCSLDLLHSVLDVPDDADRPVRLLHSSFRDFLLDPHRRDKGPFWINERTTHESLADKCLRLMSSPNGLKQNICNLSGPGSSPNEIDDRMIGRCLSSEIRYACRYWIDHLDQAHPTDHEQAGLCDDGSVHGFLKEHFLHWLEALSLMQAMSEGVLMVAKLRRLIKVSSRNSLNSALNNY